MAGALCCRLQNVAWLENYLIGLKDVTSVIVSHDSGFLDHVCQSIIHYEPNRKLRIYIVRAPLCPAPDMHAFFSLTFEGGTYRVRACFWQRFLSCVLDWDESRHG